MAEETLKTAPAAYLPFKTFISAIEALEQGLPKRLDRTIWRSQSGIVQSQIMMALRFFGLVKDDGEPTLALQRLIDNKEKRKEHIGALLHYAYKSIIDHDLTKMTPRMLEEAIGEYNVTGDTRRKAIAFFLRAAKFADLPMHPLLYGLIRETGSGTRKKRTKAVREINEVASPMIQPPPSTGGNSRRTVRLASGGTLTLEIAADPFSLSSSDREFLFSLVDKFQTYVSDSEKVEETTEGD